MTRKGRLMMVRHGQTSANIDKVWHGKTDTALTDLGREQARKLGSWFHNIAEPQVIYASPLQRAHNTAQAIADAHGMEVHLDERLVEFSLGDWEGIKFDDLQSHPGGTQLLYSDSAYAAPNGESQLMVRKRMVEAIEEITARHPDENVVLVSHGTAIGIAIAHYLHNDTTRWLEYIKHNTAVSELCLVKRELVFFNRTEHLEP
jgi:broad specificity phosphatase PhoE